MMQPEENVIFGNYENESRVKCSKVAYCNEKKNGIKKIKIG